MRRRCRHGAAATPTPRCCALDTPMRRRRRPRRWGGTDAALLRHLTCPCAESTALLCDAPALLPTHDLVLATCELLAPAVLYSVCCLCYAAHPRRAASFIVHRRAAHHRAARAACSPRRRPPPRSSLRHSLGASSLTASRRAARHLAARAPPHLPRRSLTSACRVARLHPCLIRAHSAPRCSRTASRPLRAARAPHHSPHRSPLATAPLPPRRSPPRPPHEHSMSTAWARARAWA